MTFNFTNTKYINSQDEFDNPQLGIRWYYYNSKPEYLVKHNQWRLRVGFPQILDDGHFFSLYIKIFNRVLEMYIEFRKRKLEDK